VLAKIGKSDHAAHVSMIDPTDPDAAEAILTLCRARGPTKSICPTEAARLLSGHPQDLSWRAALPRVKRAAARLAQAGMIDIVRKGKAIAPTDAHGVVRLRLHNDPETIEGAP
jgi:hypothetical protein